VEYNAVSTIIPPSKEIFQFQELNPRYKFDTFCNDYHTDMRLKSELTKAKHQDKIVRPKID
jgi:hypothetical protein